MKVYPEFVSLARDALFNDGDNLARWCGICSGEMCDDCIEIRNDAAVAVLACTLPVIAEQLDALADEQETHDDYEDGWRAAVRVAAGLVRGGFTDE